MEKIINHVGRPVSASLESRQTPKGNPVLHKDTYSIERKFVWNYMAAVGMFGYLQGSAQTDMSMVIHWCSTFCKNPKNVHKCAVKCIVYYLASMSTYTDLLGSNIQ